MQNRLRTFVQALAAFVLIMVVSACSTPPAHFSLTLLHLNDTHSHLEAVPVTLEIDGVGSTTAELGGFARIKTVLDRMRASEPDLLLLHGGDALQGTLYFTLFNGGLEFDFLNLLGLDAMTFGNHEFDRGTAPIPGWIKRSRFPWLSANIDFSAEPAIAPLVKPYLIKTVAGEKVAIIGVTTETTPQTTHDVGRVRFNDAVASTRRQVAALTAQGINKIILLSHLGYQQDLQLASQVAGVDLIIGGHSHSLLGDTTRLAVVGLVPDGAYPTELAALDGRPVLVAQAWQWGHLLGRLNVQFDRAGVVSGYSAKQVIPVGERFSRDGTSVSPESSQYQAIVNVLAQSGTAQIVAEDPAVLAALAPYQRQLAQFHTAVVARAVEDLKRGVNSGPGPLVADAMLGALPNAQVALLNYGGVRKSLLSGMISEGDLLEVMPFADTLVLIDLNGSELQAALEGNIDFLIAKYGLKQPVMPYVAGIRFNVQLSAPRGSRVTALTVRDSRGNFQPVEPAALYRTVVNTFVAGGGDGFAAVKNAAGFRSDSGIIDSDAFREYLKKLGTVSNSDEQRITILQSAGGAGQP
nr:bifunctional metallophosphatase/5'-nucleotidase [Trichlorobacter lovleyi]